MRKMSIRHESESLLPPCIKRVVQQIVGNYTMKLANTNLSEFHFQFSIHSVYIENRREVAHDTQSAFLFHKYFTIHFHNVFPQLWIQVRETYL